MKRPANNLDSKLARARLADLSIDFDGIWLRFFHHQTISSVLWETRCRWHMTGPFDSHGSSDGVEGVETEKDFCLLSTRSSTRVHLKRSGDFTCCWLTFANTHTDGCWPMDVASGVPKSFTFFRWNWATPVVCWRPFHFPACVVHFSEAPSLASDRSPPPGSSSVSGPSQLLSALTWRSVWLVGWLVCLEMLLFSFFLFWKDGG